MEFMLRDMFDAKSGFLPHENSGRFQFRIGMEEL
jgi:hypothetical protein